MCTCVLVYLHACVCVHACVYIHMCVLVYIRVFVYIHVCEFICKASGNGPAALVLARAG